MNDQPKLSESIGQDAHVLIQARRLPPMDVALTDQQIHEVRQDFLAYMNKHKDVLASHVARQLGVSGGTMSSWQSSKYKGDNNKLARQVNNWMEQDARRRRSDLPDVLIHTNIADSIMGITYNSLANGFMAVVVVPAGAGKTMVLKHLASKTAGFYVYCDGDLTVSQFMRTLARLVGVDRLAAPAGELKARIIEKLRGTNRPVFLDEAHQLPSQVFSRIRSIHDQAGVSFIFAGTYEILDAINDQANGRGQLSSRCYRYNALEHLYAGESPDGSAAMGRPLFSEDEIRSFLDQVYVKVDPDAFTLLHALACLPGRGCLRTVRGVLKLVLQRWPMQTVTRQNILWALPIQFGQEGRIMARQADKFAKGLEQAAAKRKAS